MRRVVDRRRFLRILSSAPLAMACAAAGARPPRGVLPAGGEEVQDVHSALSAARVERVMPLDGADSARRILLAARAAGRPVAIAGGRHAMGGQQFLANGWLLDTRTHDHVRDFDPARRTVTVDSGMQWPDLLAFLSTTWDESGAGLTIAQKQVGADRLSLGGTLSANAHGCALSRPPVVDDVERFTLMDAGGREQTIDRGGNRNLFRLAVGGYGLLGLITDVTLRLVERQKLERVVTEERIDDLARILDERARAGHPYARMLLAIDPADDAGFLRAGVLTSYRPVPATTPIPPDQRVLAPADRRALLLLAHRDPAAASREYVRHYLATSGQIHWSDSLQRSDYQNGYHTEIDRELGRGTGGSETRAQLNVPRERLAELALSAGAILRAARVPVVEASVRVVEPDLESFLPWARDRFACLALDLHVDHTPPGIDRVADACRRLIDAALDLGGTFYLTYDRFATRAQIEAAYPRFPEFLRLKRIIDPEERFQSDWYRRCRELFG